MKIGPTRHEVVPSSVEPGLEKGSVDCVVWQVSEPEAETIAYYVAHPPETPCPDVVKNEVDIIGGAQVHEDLRYDPHFLEYAAGWGGGGGGNGMSYHSSQGRREIFQDSTND